MATLRLPTPRSDGGLWPLALTRLTRTRVAIGVGMAAFAVAAALLLTIGPLSSAMPWAHHHVDVSINDVQQVTVDRTLAFRSFDLVDGDPAQNADVVRLVEALQSARGLGHPQDDVLKGGYPDTVLVDRADGSRLTITPAAVCSGRNNEGACSQFAYAQNDFQVYDSNGSRDGEVYHSPELRQWFDDVFARYY